MQIFTTVEQQKEVYSQLDEESRKGWSLLFEDSERPVFSPEQIALIKGEQK